MSRAVPLLVIGAGPAGLAAAAAAAEAGVEVVLLDNQANPGGQIYRGLAAGGAGREALGADYLKGLPLLEGARHAGVEQVSGASVWQVSRERQVHATREGKVEAWQAERLILATGAMERPMPFPGWTLPGVMTAGAGQILLKASGLLPQGRVVLAGSGPLLFLLANQYLSAGVTPAALVETTPGGRLMQSLNLLPGALRAPAYLTKGMGLLRAIRRIPRYRQARDLQAEGGEALEALSFTAQGGRHRVACDLLLLHQGVVPNLQMTRALGLAHDWDGRARCWRPRLGAWGESEIAGIAVAGDGGGIVGAAASALQGRLAGLQAAHRLGALSEAERDRQAAPLQRALARERAARPFLDQLYAPDEAFLAPSDETLVCRCEEVRAGQIRAWVGLGCLGPNQTKSFGRPGMGPCQGRMCGLTVSEIIAKERGVSPAEVGYYRIRPPILPVTLGELATLEDSTDHAEVPESL